MLSHIGVAVFRSHFKTVKKTEKEVPMEKLLEIMREKEIDWYLVPTSDFHDSEYVSPYFQGRSHFSGFTGSAGILVAGLTESVLFTDGRYFIQAEQELEDSGIALMRMGQADVPTLGEYLEQKIQVGQKLGVDGRLISYRFGQELERIVKAVSAELVWQEDLTELAWPERPALEFHDTREIPESYFGESRTSKISRVRKIMREENADAFILTTLDDIAWLFNLRGNDVANNPVILAYAILTGEDAFLFMHKEALKQELPGITVKDYFEFYDCVSVLPKGSNIMLDASRANYAVVQRALECGHVMDGMNPTTKMKAVKNETEIQNTKKAHIADGVAVTKFMYWLKHNVGKTEITEVTAADYLEQLRRAFPDCFDLSFPTICAYNANGAMMHYSASAEHAAVLKPEGFLLVDSGGQYLQGTTDITRTFVLGELTDEMRMHFTMVAKAMLRLQNAKFLYGCTGLNLDILARGVMWEKNLDYQCGTGHGVGHVLNVHENPNSFRWLLRGDWEDGVLEAGMITTDEPGIYLEGAYGIRLENELLCIKGIQNEYGQFMEFEPLTFVPIDLDGIDTRYLEPGDIENLNRYHRAVYEQISPYLNEAEREWLKDCTRKVDKIHT